MIYVRIGNSNDLIVKKFDLALAYVYWQRGEVALADAQFRVYMTMAAELPSHLDYLPSRVHACMEAARLHYHFGGYECMPFVSLIQQR